MALPGVYQIFKTSWRYWANWTYLIVREFIYNRK